MEFSDASAAGGLAAGQLLVSSPTMTDPNFVDSVVLLLDVDDEGVLGVVLNRPSPILVDAVMEGWTDFVAVPEVLFQGGPVGREGALALALLRSPAHPSQWPTGFNPVLGPLGLLDLETPVEQVADLLVAVRLFAGYAGWGPGQLQGEVAAGDWDVVPATIDDVFAEEASGLWRDVLRRQPGELAWRSTRPADPALN